MNTNPFRVERPASHNLAKCLLFASPRRTLGFLRFRGLGHTQQRYGSQGLFVEHPLAGGMRHALRQHELPLRQSPVELPGAVGTC